jgi:hypothetical protein
MVLRVRLKSTSSRAAVAAIAVGVGLAAMTPSAAVLPAAGAPVAASRSAASVQGTVMADGAAQAGFEVSLYAAAATGRPRWVRLGNDTSDSQGRFEISYPQTARQLRRHADIFLAATRGPAMLVSAIGDGTSTLTKVVINERTTVATGSAFAQFVHGSTVVGNRYGMSNAVHMAANFADPSTGAVGATLANSPNGDETSTLATFNSLTNAVTSCVVDDASCRALFHAATPPGGQAPRTVLQAVANIVRYPSYTPDRSAVGDPLFRLSLVTPVHQPALTEPPTNWLLFLKFTGGEYSAQDHQNLMSGPGNFAIDAKGFVWANDNAVPQAPDHFACGGRRLLKFYPWGASAPGSPYFGGGLSGAGYGITLDPSGRVWIGNFGFQDPPCALLPQAVKSNSVSAFRPSGVPISGRHGFTDGDISWPQGTISDRQGNIWLANCGNDSVTKIPDGDPTRAINISLGPTPTANRPQIKPFDAVTDLKGNVWVTDNRSDTVSVLSPHGDLLATLPAQYNGRTVLSHPVGAAADTHGNVWVANSDWLDVPCPTRFQLGTAESPSVTMFRQNSRTPYPGSPFTGGGLTLPWGIAVDGDDAVWAFNFGAATVGTSTDTPTGISRFCGIATRNCPPGVEVGDPISPDTGYQSDALERITGGEIDPSGNIWLTNNWKLDANPILNPFGNAIVIAVGAAGPVKTPLIGPVVSFHHGR